MAHADSPSISINRATAGRGATAIDACLTRNTTSDGPAGGIVAGAGGGLGKMEPASARTAGAGAIGGRGQLAPELAGSVRRGV